MGVRTLTLSVVLGLASIAAQPAPPRPVDPVAAIIEAFDTHDLVALGDAHGNEQSHAVRLALVRDPRFAARVQDIVVEFGNARSQPLIDRYIEGADVDATELRHVWEDTTQFSGVWDRPIYGDFFSAVREVNAALPPSRRLRVLLADPPVDWDLVRRIDAGPPSGREGLVRINGVWIEKAQESTLDRDAHAAQLVLREVVARHRRALLVFGDGHLRRGTRGLVTRLEASAAVKVFTIGIAVGRAYAALAAERPDIGSWAAPGLLGLSRTAESAVDGHFDAVLHLGPPSALTSSRIAPARCADTAYVSMRQQRMAWAGLPDERARELLARDCSAPR
jgi:Haem-binding uptake, Tiki superfamily, ChaN